MALPKKSLIWIFVIAIIVIIAAIVIYLFRCDLFKNLTSCVQDPNDSNTPVPSGSPTTKWIPEVPPYNLGMFGPKIKALQKALGFSVTDQDGKFGNQTAAAIIAKGKAVPLSEPDYNAIVNPAASGGGSNFQQLKQALSGGSANFSGGITYLVQGQNKNYQFDFYAQNGRFFVHEQGVTTYIKKGTYSNGGKKMVIDAGDTYEGTALANMTKIIKDIE